MFTCPGRRVAPRCKNSTFCEQAEIRNATSQGTLHRKLRTLATRFGCWDCYMHFLMVHASQRKCHFPCNIRKKNFRRKKRNATISQFWGVATLAIFDLSVSLGHQTFSNGPSTVQLFSPFPSHFWGETRQGPVWNMKKTPRSVKKKTE